MFAQSVSSAQAIKDLAEKCEREKVTTGKSTIADEKTWNPFMRLDVTPSPLSHPSILPA